MLYTSTKNVAPEVISCLIQVDSGQGEKGQVKGPVNCRGVLTDIIKWLTMTNQHQMLSEVEFSILDQISTKQNKNDVLDLSPVKSASVRKGRKNTVLPQKMRGSLNQQMMADHEDTESFVMQSGIKAHVSQQVLENNANLDKHSNRTPLKQHPQYIKKKRMTTVGKTPNRIDSVPQSQHSNKSVFTYPDNIKQNSASMLGKLNTVNSNSNLNVTMNQPFQTNRETPERQTDDQPGGLKTFQSSIKKSRIIINDDIRQYMKNGVQEQNVVTQRHFNLELKELNSASKE